VFIPHPYVSVNFNSDVSAMARPILQIAGAAQIVYGGGIVLAHALQAAGATFYVMMVEVLTHWIIFLPTCYTLGVVLGGGIVGAWMALPVYIVAYTALIYLKYTKGGWLLMKL
jgi:multidrug resistance protein, MATE family